MQFHKDLPSLENLQCFLAAAEQLNFSRAAKLRHITAAAFGQRIKQLEQQMGCALFVRLPRSVELTLEGQRLVPAARAVIREALACYEAVHGAWSQPVQLRLGTRFELGMSWVLPAVVAWEREMGTVQIDLYFGSGEDLLERLRGREVDAIITSAPEIHRSWAAEFLHEEEYVFVGAPSLLEDRSLERITDAGEHTLLDIDASLPLARYLTSLSGELSFAQIRSCGTGAAIYEMVLLGLGVAVLPAYMVRQDLADGRLRRLLPEQELLSDSFRLLFDRNAVARSYLEAIAAFLRERPLQ